MAEQRVQRRLAAILAADVVGYSRQMGADEEGTLARLNALRSELLHPKLSEYGGRIVKTTGDGTLIEFQSAVDAVQAAIDIQQALSRRNADLPESDRIEIRMGINLGDIIVEGEDIFGEGVNVAARIEGLAEPGGICLSSIVHESVRTKLDVNFTALGEQSLKNIADPVGVYRVTLGPAALTVETPTSLESIFRHPAVAVLPFENLSGDPEQEYFADGLTEDIITALSLWRSFPVIARNSTFAYKGTSPDVRRVGNELGARYIIEGSVRKGGDRLRVTVQLINAETGHHVWAERYDRELADIFAVQDELTQKIAGIVAPRLEGAERQRSMAKAPSSLDAWDCYLRGMACVHEYTVAANREARDLFERAIALEATYSRGHSGLAYSDYRAVWFRYAESREETLARCLAAARRAVALDDADSFAHFVLSRGQYLSGQFEDAIDQANMALAINPNDVQAHLSLGHSLISAGRPEEGIAEVELGLRLDPRDPRAHAIHTALSYAHFSTRRYEDAVAAARQAINRRSDNLDAHLMLASSLGQAGKLEEARATLDQCARIQRDFEAIPRPLQVVSPANIEHFLAGLRKAGWEG